MTDRIEKTVELDAPVERVWRAISDHQEFGAWFRVSLDGPFRLGEITTGQMTYPDYEHIRWESRVMAIDPPRLFSFAWPAYSAESGLEDTSAPWILVEFRLEPIGTGTRLTVTESGFDALPPSRRDQVLRDNEGGWEEQMRNVKAHVEG